MKPTDLKFPYPWEERKPFLLGKVLFIPEHYDRHHEWIFPGWASIFGNDRAVNIEYCSGNGMWIAEKAKKSKENWVAVEYRFDRVRQIWAKMHNWGISNLLIVCGEALTFATEYLPDFSVAEVFVNFPDPWPKKKHAKNRLFQQPFIEQLARTVRNTVTVATDSEEYGDQILNEMQGWKATFQEPHFITEWPGYGTSFFETLWKQKGKTLRYYQFGNRNLKTVILDASISSDLNWTVPDVENILWELDFGVLKDIHFHTYALAVEHFAKNIWRSDSKGVVLYRGSLDIVQSVEEADYFADFLHRLASFLPDEATPYCLFEGACSFTKAKSAQLMSKDRFWHLHLSLEENKSSKGVLLPSDPYCTTEALEKLEAYLVEDYRIIPEMRLNEMWDGLDELYVAAVSPQGLRHVKGFIAAGGKVFGAEGFEPPTHCSQSSCASQTALCSEQRI